MSAGCIGSVLTSPLRWNGRDAAWAGGLALSAGGSFLLDDEVRSLALRNQSQFNDDVVVPVGHLYATVLYVGPSALVMYLAGRAFDDPWVHDTGQMLVESVITIGIVQVPLSIAVGRARPFFNEGNTSFKAFAGTNDDRASFFSGHSMVAFSFSTILSHQIGNTWASIGLYALAALGPYARLYKDKHWFSDTFPGCALGVFAGNSIWEWHQQHKQERGTESGFKILPSPAGVSVVWTF